MADRCHRLKSVMEAKLREKAEMRVAEPATSRPFRAAHIRDGMPNSPSLGHSGLGALLRASEQLSGTSPSSATGTITRDGERREHSPAHTASSASPEPEGYFGESSTFAFVSKVQPTTYARNNPNQHKRRRLSSTRSAKTPGTGLADIGLSPPQETHDCYQLPPKHLADSLLDAYFARVHRLYPFVHEPTFRLDYERMYLLDGTSESVARSRPVWIGLLNMIFAHGAEFCDLVPEQDSVELATAMVNNARRIVFSHIFKEASLELVQALLLLCQYLQSTLELNECWSLVGLLIRTAIGLGLHLNPPQSDGRSSLEREFRIRTWWGCFIIDRTLSMKFGRPPTIEGESAFDVDLPLEVDDQYINQGSVSPRQPENRPSLITFFSRTIHKVEIMGKVLGQLYHPRQKPYSKRETEAVATHSYVISHSVLLDGELVSWWDQNPLHLRQKPAVHDGPEFELQRNVLLTRYINLRLLIHRQTFLIFSKHDIEDPFQRAVAIASCRVCLDTARQVIEVIHENHHRRMLNSLWYSLHYVFTAMGVLLSLRTMDKAKLEAIGETGRDDDRALELGMEFLRAASRISTLAARYVAMLRRIWRGAADGSDGGFITTSRKEVSPPPAVTVAAGRTVASQNESGISPLSMDPPGSLALFDDVGIGSFDHDLLFGTGLPRDLLTTDWSTFGFSF